MSLHPINLALSPTAWSVVFTDLGLTTRRQKRRLIAGVNDAAEHVSLARTKHAIRQPRRLARKLSSLERAAENASSQGKSLSCRNRAVLARDPTLRRLVRYQAAFEIDCKSEQETLLDGRADARLTHAIEHAPVNLVAWARRAHASIARKADAALPAHLPDEALNTTITLLGITYWEATGHLPGASYGCDAPGGPFVRFLKYVLPHIGWPYPFTNHGLRKRIQRLQHAGAWRDLQSST